MSIKCILTERYDTNETSVIFTPSISDSGELSWTNNGGLENPKPINIIGPTGPQGIPGEQGADGLQGSPGRDAVINGLSTLEIQAGNNVTIDQNGTILTINASDSNFMNSIIKITFEAVFVGQQYTVTDGEDTITGIVPESLVASVQVKNCNSAYTVSVVTDNGLEYSTAVIIGPYYGQYTASLIAFTAIINVTALPGAEVKAVKDDSVSVAVADESGVAVVKVNQAGVYIITAIKDGATSNSTSVNVMAEIVYITEVKFIILTVKTELGNSIAVTKDSEHLARTSTGSDTFYLPSTGTWTVTISKEGKAKNEMVNCADYQNYELRLTFADIFGVMWDKANPSTALTRLTTSNDPNNLVTVNIESNPSPAVGIGAGSSLFDTYAPWKDMDEYNIVDNAVGARKGTTEFSRTANDVMVYIPEYWFKITESDDKRYFYISDVPKSDFAKHPGSGKYVGRYNTGDSNGYVSRSGLAPLALSRTTARTNSKAKGSMWSQYDFATWNAVWLLYLVEFADWDSQAKIGKGVASASAAVNSGGTDSMTYHTGRAAGTDGQTAVQYRHIENPWGSIAEWIDGINFSGNTAYVCTNPADYADNTTTNYTDTGITSSCGGWIKDWALSSNSPWAFLPTTDGGSETTYIPDKALVGNGALLVGGCWQDGSLVGLFDFNSLARAGSSGPWYGSRLVFHPKNLLYATVCLAQE